MELMPDPPVGTLFDDAGGVDVGAFTKSFQDFFVDEGKTSPGNVLAFILFLQKVNNIVTKSLATGGGATVDDFLTLAVRNARYEVMLQEMRKTTEERIAGNVAQALWASLVVGPLLLGWYPLREQQTIPFASEVVSQINVVEASQQSSRDAWDGLVHDLSLGLFGRDPVEPPGGYEWPWWAWGIVGAVSLGTLGTVVAIRAPRRLAPAEGGAPPAEGG
jgi:hypothetical protein